MPGSHHSCKVLSLWPPLEVQTSNEEGDEVVQQDFIVLGPLFS